MGSLLQFGFLSGLSDILSTCNVCGKKAIDEYFLMHGFANKERIGGDFEATYKHNWDFAGFGGEISKTLKNINCQKYEILKRAIFVCHWSLLPRRKIYLCQVIGL